MGRVENKIAVVTGGGSGIGQGTAILLASEGAKLVVTDLDPDQGEATVKKIQDNGGEAIFSHHDVSSEADWQRVLDTTTSTFASPNILVNNAGILLFRDLAKTTVEEWH